MAQEFKNAPANEDAFNRLGHAAAVCSSNTLSEFSAITPDINNVSFLRRPLGYNNVTSVT